MPFTIIIVLASVWALAEDKPVRIDKSITPPALVKKVEPKFPTREKGEKLKGSIVILEAVVNRSGNVANIKVLRSVHPKFDEAVVAAVKQWKYKPASKKGKPISVYFVVTCNIDFR